MKPIDQEKLAMVQATTERINNATTHLKKTTKEVERLFTLIDTIRNERDALELHLNLNELSAAQNAVTVALQNTDVDSESKKKLAEQWDALSEKIRSVYQSTEPYGEKIQEILSRISTLNQFGDLVETRGNVGNS